MFSTTRSVHLDHAYVSLKRTDYYKSILVTPTIRPIVIGNEYIDVVDTPLGSSLPTGDPTSGSSSHMQLFHPTKGDLTSSLALGVTLKAPSSRDDEYSDVYGSDVVTLQNLFHSQAFDMLWVGSEDISTNRWSSGFNGSSSSLSTHKNKAAGKELLLSSTTSGKEAADRWKFIIKQQLGLEDTPNEMENQSKSSITNILKNVLEKLFDCLEAVLLKKNLIYTQNNDNREVLQQIIYEKLAKQLRSLFLELNWDATYLPRIHGYLLQHLPIGYLICYTQALYSLRHKYHQSVLVDELNTLTSATDIVTRFRMDHFIGFLHNDRSNMLVDRALRSLTWRHPSQPRIVCIRFPVSETSHRFTNMQRMLQRFAQVQCLDMPTNATALLAADLRDSVAGVRQQQGLTSSPRGGNSGAAIDPLSSVHMASVINGWRKQIQLESNGEQPLFLFGIGAAAIIVLQLARSLYFSKTKTEPQQSPQEYDAYSKSTRPNLMGVICLGPPVVGLLGERRPSHEREWSLSELSTLMVSGTLSLLGPSSSVQSWQEHLSHLIAARSRSAVNTLAERARLGAVAAAAGAGGASDLRTPPPLPLPLLTQSRHIRIGGADHLLRLTQQWKELYSVTQEQVDVFLMTEVRQFLMDTMSMATVRKTSLPSVVHSGNKTNPVSTSTVHPSSLPYHSNSGSAEIGTLASKHHPSSSVIPSKGAANPLSAMLTSSHPSSGTGGAGSRVAAGTSLLHPQLREENLMHLPSHLLALSSGSASGVTGKATAQSQYSTAYPSPSYMGTGSHPSTPWGHTTSQPRPVPPPSISQSRSVSMHASTSSNYVTTPRTWFSTSQQSTSRGGGGGRTTPDLGESGSSLTLSTSLNMSRVSNQHSQPPTPMDAAARVAAAQQRSFSAGNGGPETPRSTSSIPSRYHPYERR